jgi:hypothetical protein
MIRRPNESAKLAELPYLTTFILADGFTSEAFQLYNFFLAIGFLAFGLLLTR